MVKEKEDEEHEKEDESAEMTGTEVQQEARVKMSGKRV